MVNDRDRIPEEGSRAPTDEPSVQRSGGVNFSGGPVTIGGDVVGRDKIVHGDQVRGDKIEGHVGAVGAGAQVAIGKQIDQTMTSPAALLSAAERAEVDGLLAQLRDRLAQLEAPEGKKLAGREAVTQLAAELGKTDQPADPSAVQTAGNWLLDNLPALTGAVAHVMTNPILAKVVPPDWLQHRFGGPS